GGQGAWAVGPRGWRRVLCGAGGAGAAPRGAAAAAAGGADRPGGAPEGGGAQGRAHDWMVETLGTLKVQHREREALLKRSWSDAAFEEGEAGNDKVIEGFELELVTMLRESKKGLRDGVVLGNAIDLAGAYKKNYKLDKSEAVLLRCTRHAESRSGAWMVKYLNHISQVRMKQRRNAEALEMMYEIESLASFPLEEPGASEFYETLYRNMSSCLRSMGREDEAAVYFMKMAEAARYHKASLDWMDLWDLGVLIANRAYQSGRWAEFHKSREIIAEALRMQKIAEPHELILRAKVLSNLGQTFLATDELEECEEHYSEAYALFDATVGKRSPLFGMQAWACGNLRCAQGRHREALPLLGEALYVEVVGDGLSVSEMAKLHDQILHSLHECGGDFSDNDTDSPPSSGGRSPPWQRTRGGRRWRTPWSSRCSPTRLPSSTRPRGGAARRTTRWPAASARAPWACCNGSLATRR
ncbi:unnamed protein product, partial [Prorocentrum cordatum]